MTDKEIQQLTDRYLEGSTSPDEELLLARELQRPDISEEWQAVRLMLGGLALGEAEYDAMMDRRKASAHRRPAPRRRWWWVAAAACIVALLSLHAIYDNVKTKPLAEEARVSPKAPPSAPEGEAPPSAPEGATIAQPLNSKTIEAPIPEQSSPTRSLSVAVGGASPVPPDKQALADIYLAEVALQVAYQQQEQQQAVEAYAASLVGEEPSAATPIIAF